MPEMPLESVGALAIDHVASITQLLGISIDLILEHVAAQGCDHSHTKAGAWSEISIAAGFSMPYPDAGIGRRGHIE